MVSTTLGFGKMGEKMRIDETKIPPNLLNEVSLPQCNKFREQAENIITLLRTMQPFPYPYSSMGEFDKVLIAEYWRHFDGLGQKLVEENRLGISRFVVFREWFVKGATNPEHIRRARQWLVENGILIPNPRVLEKAQNAGEETRMAIRAARMVGE
jgi:hypothetical protein